MSKESSFDIVSRVDMQEVQNAVHQAQKAMEQRFDFRGSKSSIDLDEKKGVITVIGDDDMKLRNVVDLLEQRLTSRGVSLRSLKYSNPEPAAGGTLRRTIELVQGINADKAKEITRTIRDSKIKVTAQVQGDQVRVAGKNKDDLQAVIALLRKQDFGLELQFVNYR